MCPVPNSQAKGSAGALLLDFEDLGFNCLNIPADRVPWNIPFNTNDLTLSRALNQAATIRGDRNPSPPFSGNKDVSGTIVVPVNFIQAGLFLRMAIGDPVTTEEPQPDVGLGGTGAINASGDVVWSVPQTGIALGDRVNLTLDDGTTVVDGYITVRTDDSNMTIKLERDGASNLPSLPQTAATLNFAVTNISSGLPDTLSITSGVMDFNTPQASVAVGQQVIYDTNKKAYVTAVNSTSQVVVVDAVGLTPADEVAVDMETLEAKPKFRHKYTIDPVESLISATLARGFQDLSPEVWQYFTGCKINTWGIEIGGDGELLLTLGIIGADRVKSNTPFDDPPSPSRLQPPLDRFEQFDASAEEGGSAVEVLTAFSINVNNNLDTDTFTIGGGGTRRALPEGIANVGGSISALFEDETILTKAQDNITSSLRAIFTQAGNELNIFLPELKYQSNDPAIPGPAGVSIDLEYQAFFSTNPDSSGIVVELLNDQPAYF